MTLKEFGGHLKNLSGLVGTVLAQLESWWRLLPINPAIRIDWLTVSSFMAVFCGFIAYQLAIRRPNTRVGVAALSLMAFTFMVMIASNVGLLNAFPAKAVSFAVQISYVGFFATIGAAIGRFIA